MTVSRLYNKNKKNELKHTQKNLPKQTNKHEKKNSHCS